MSDNLKETIIVLPEYSTDVISENLRDLTEKLHQKGAEIGAGILGGDYGYGAHFENDMFAMHPYCWCEEETCLWCNPCVCPDEAFIYTVDGREVTWNTYISLDRQSRSKVSTEIVKEKQCNRCRTDRETAPNFLHKPSGSKIYWYKYIGRGMEVTLHENWDTIYTQCLNSLQD